MTGDKKRFHPHIRLGKDAYTNPDGLYLISLCSHERSPVFQDDRVAAEIVATIRWLHQVRKTRVWAHCVMPDHVHLLISPDREDHVARLMSAFKRVATSRCRHLGLGLPLWQNRYHDRVLRDSDNGLEAAEYILQNPARAGIVSQAEDYRHSGVIDVLDESMLRFRRED